MDARSALLPAVGIDLGTTYSCLAYVDSHGRPLTLPNAEGDLLTPSAVLFDGDEVIVGREAIKALATDAPLVATLVKREMGSRAFSQPVADAALPPEVIQARILYKLRRDARPQLGDVQQAVITVPAYFDEVRRRATHDAGYMAGLEVLDILNEPTAAALSFGYQQGFLDDRGAAHAPLNLLVYDLGGGTFDVTVITVTGRDFVTRAIDGDVRLGGSDWDERLVQEVAELFIRQFDLDPRSDLRAWARLVRECEEAKRTLSARSRAAIAFDWQGHALRTEFTRERFESLSADLLDRTRFTAKEALRAAGLDWGRIDRVLLVGGSSRMPAVRTMLTQLTGKPPDDSLAADEAVALGAALHAQRCQAERAGQPIPFRIRNVNSHSLGVVATDPLTRRPQTALIIPRNTPLPASRRRRFQAQKQGQESLLVQVVEGESASPEACVALGRCVLRSLPANLPAAAPVDVEFRYAADGTLQVKVVVAGTDAELEVEFQRPNSLSRSELYRWRHEITRCE